MHPGASVYAGLKAVDKLTLAIIVDNETDGISSPCACCAAPAPTSAGAAPDAPACSYVSEFTRIAKGGELNFDRSCYAGHGLSILLTAEVDGKQRKLLFDAGPTEELWARNADRWRLPLADVEACVLSHWHMDHSGGIPAVVRAVGPARAEAGRPPMTLDVHPDRPRQRGVRMPSQAGGGVLLFSEDPDPETFPPEHCAVERHAEPHALLGDCFYVSGAIPRVTDFETGQPGHMSMDAAGEWHDDPLIMDERYVAVNVQGRGPVVLSACSHAGIINVLHDVAAVADCKVHAVVGGLHLVSPPCEARVPATSKAMAEADPDLVLAGHCTGWRGKAALAAALPGRYMTCVVGATYTFRGTESS